MSIAPAAPASLPVTPLLTAEEFLDRYGHPTGVELVHGKVVWNSSVEPVSRPVPQTDGPSEGEVRPEGVSGCEWV